MKESAGNDLLRAIREIADGHAFFSPAIARRLLNQPQENFFKNFIKKVVTLTSRQMEVLQLIAEEYSNKQMGGLLCLSIKTVEKHRQGLMAKLDIHNVAHLTPIRDFQWRRRIKIINRAGFRVRINEIF